MRKNLILAAGASFLFIQSASAQIISMADGQFYSKVESSYANDSNGKNENNFEQTYMPDVAFSHEFSFDANSPANQAVEKESGFSTFTRNTGTPQEEQLETSWIRGIYDAYSEMPSTPFTSELFSLVDTSLYNLNESLSMWAIDEVTTNITTGEVSYLSSLNFSYTLTGDRITENQGITTSDSFNYFMNIFLDIAPSDSADNLFGVDAFDVEQTLLSHEGLSLTITEGINLDRFSSDNLGFFDSEGMSLMYVGNSNISSVQVPVPGSLALALLGGLMLFRKRMKD